jgi:hypothetical protein
MLRAAAIGLFAGVLVGVLAGIAARIAMRLVALAGGAAPSFSVPGTLVILLVAVFYGVTGGLLFAIVGRRLPGSRTLKGLSYGVLVLLLFGPVYFVSDQEGELRVSPLVGVLSFSILFVVGAAMIAVMTAWLDGRLPQDEDTQNSRAYRVCGVLGVLIAVGSLPAVAARVALAVQRVGAVTVGS